MFLFVIEINIHVLIFITLIIFFIFLFVFRSLISNAEDPLDKYIYESENEIKTLAKRKKIEHSKLQYDLSKEISSAPKEDDLNMPDNKTRGKGIYIDFRKIRK